MIGMISIGLYRDRQRQSMTEVTTRVSVALVLAGVAALLASFLFPPVVGGRTVVLFATTLSFPALLIVRKVFYDTIDGRFLRRKVVVLGGGANARPIARLRRKADQRSFQIIGFLPVGQEEIVPECKNRICRPLSLADFVEENEISEIVVAIADQRQQLPIHELLACRSAGVRVVEAAAFLEQEAGRVDLDVLRPTWLVYSKGFNYNTLQRFAKRSFDILASAILLTIMLPVIVLTALAVRFEDGFRGPILYRQKRVGYRGKEFNTLKFRSMRPDAEPDGQAVWASADDERVTRVGRVIRRYRLDELPQIYNILRGDMSFVGPRPERPEFVRQLSEAIPLYDHRHSVKPGLTGWAQLCYPYGATVEEARDKLEYELYYVKNQSVLFDLMILLQTLEVVVWGRSSVMPGAPAVHARRRDRGVVECASADDPGGRRRAA